jgi:YggT family protein
MDLTSTLTSFVSILCTVLSLAIIVRALMSWVMPVGGSGISRVLIDVTEPILAPIRRVLPPLGGIDFSPLLAIILIQVIQSVVTNYV